jgi:hypothetical protein
VSQFSVLIAANVIYGFAVFPDGEYREFELTVSRNVFETLDMQLPIVLLQCTPWSNEANVFPRLQWESYSTVCNVSSATVFQWYPRAHEAFGHVLCLGSG